jgi:polysaccharide export outer membrane protein
MCRKGNKFVYLWLALIIPLQLFAVDDIAEYRIRQNDVLDVYVLNHPELDKSVVVSADGYISYPLVGTIKVAGLITSEVADKIKTELSQYIIEPKVTVSLAKFAGKKVHVIGEVKRPGTFDYVEGMEVTYYLALAGGPTLGSDLSKTRVIRMGEEGPKVFHINLNKVLKKGHKGPNIILQSGDTVVIPETLLYRIRDLTPLMGVAVGILSAYLIYLARAN